MLFMPTDSVHAARLRIAKEIAEVLVDLADVPESEPDFEDLSAAMLDAADILLEDLGLEVTAVDDNVIHAILRLGPHPAED